MRRKNPCAFRALLPFCVFVLQMLFIPSLQSQINNPVQWSSIVNNTQYNPLLIDTFLIQSFEGKITDIWGYTTDKGIIFDASADGITGQGGDKSLKLLSNTNVVFDDFDIAPYVNVKVKTLLAGKSLTKDESLTVESDRVNGLFKRVWSVAQTNNYTVQYRQDLIGDGGKRTNPIQIDTNPHNIRLYTSAQEEGGYFCIDSVLAQGEIPYYSLFTGKGFWGDETHWSHLTPKRRRSALVNGELTIDSDAQCDQILLSDGNLQLNAGSKLTINNITFFGLKTSFSSAGELNVLQQVNVQRTFPEGGCWYFISFPFDVYKSGIDPAFQLKDASPNSGGNYIYVLTYNGKKRSEQNKAVGNWEVLSPLTLGEQPVFRKNKGYLIALDEKATLKTIKFSSASGVIPSDFGKVSGIIPIDAPIGGDQAHAGWYLCGNPFPTSLSLMQIASNSNTDGNIYVYDGSVYKSYAIGTNYELPPYAAFFVKAKSNTQLQVKETRSVTKGMMLTVDSPLRAAVEEPVTTMIPTSINDPILDVRSYVRGNVLYVENLPQSSKLIVYDLNGRNVYKTLLSQGNMSIYLPLDSGFYLIKIESSIHRTQFKCFIAQ